MVFSCVPLASVVSTPDFSLTYIDCDIVIVAFVKVLKVKKQLGKDS